MTLRPVDPPRGERRDGFPKPCPPTCPVCEGRMQVIYARNNRQVCACDDCRTTITVPAAAWERARKHRRLGTVLPRPE